MPNRILREGILTSARVDRLSEGAEIFYRRLQSRVDDYGRHEAHPELLRTACYPLRVDRVKAKHIIGWMEECERAGLVAVYRHGSKTYLQVLDWRQQIRTESKFPGPDEQVIRRCIANATQMVSTCDANAHLVGGGGVVEGVGEIASAAKAAPAGPVDNSVCLIPLNDGSEFNVTEAIASELSKLYPRVDIAQTLNEIRGWNLANPHKRKTKRGVLNHINVWMAKEQNRGA